MQCNKCRHVFNYTDAKKITRKLYNVDIIEKRCPKCGGTFRAINVPSDLDVYLYINDDARYYSYE